MRNLRDRGELSDELFEAWSQIDNGEVLAGTEGLLRHEQGNTLQQEVYNPHAKAFAYMSWVSQHLPSQIASPVPGDNTTFQDAVPGGDLGQFNDRWEWITSSMLPAWEQLRQDAPDSVRQAMEEFSSNIFQPTE